MQVRRYVERHFAGIVTWPKGIPNQSALLKRSPVSIVALVIMSRRIIAHKTIAQRIMLLFPFEEAEQTIEQG